MTKASPLTTIDFLTHSKVRIAAAAAAIWPHILNTDAWREGQRLIPIGGEPGHVGERFHAAAAETPETPHFFVENVELAPQRRRTIRMESLEGAFLGFSTWELTPGPGETVVAYDTYCRGPLLAPGRSAVELLANAQKVMDEGLQRLKAVVEG